MAVENCTDPVEERQEVAVSPTAAADGAERALTGCCGLTIDGHYAYDHRTRWVFTNVGLLHSESRYGGGSGRGKWHLRT